jgi:hypothetical protein
MTFTARSAGACEGAKSPAASCKCRCKGAAHGLHRGRVRDLAVDDPHHPEDPPPRRRRRSSPQQLELGDVWTDIDPIEGVR